MIFMALLTARLQVSIPMWAVCSYPCKRYRIWSAHNTEALQNPESHFYIVDNAKYTLSEANTCVVYCECRLDYKTYNKALFWRQCKLEPGQIVRSHCCKEYTIRLVAVVLYEFSNVWWWGQTYMRRYKWQRVLQQHCCKLGLECMCVKVETDMQASDSVGGQNKTHNPSKSWNVSQIPQHF